MVSPVLKRKFSWCFSNVKDMLPSERERLSPWCSQEVWRNETGNYFLTTWLFSPCLLTDLITCFRQQWCRLGFKALSFSVWTFGKTFLTFHRSNAYLQKSSLKHTAWWNFRNQTTPAAPGIQTREPHTASIQRPIPSFLQAATLHLQGSHYLASHSNLVWASGEQ